LYLERAGSPVDATSIKATFFNPNTGTLNTYTVATNAAGQAVFNYTAPASLPTNDLLITFAVENGSSVVDENVTVKFGGLTVPPVETANLKLYAVPSALSVSTAGGARVINLYLENNATNSPQGGVTIKADFFDPNNGTLGSYSVATNASGQAVFNYTAPDTLPVGTILSIKFDVENASNTIAQDVNVSFVDGATPIDYSGYTFTVLSNELNISEAGQVRTIDAYLEDANKQPGEGEIINVDFFDGSKGAISSFSGVIDALGHVVFTYTAPADISTLDGYEIRLSMENNSSQEQNITINVDNATYVLTADENITITEASQVSQIKVVLTQQNGTGPISPAVGKVVVAEFLMPIFGTIASYEAVVDASGNAIFNYTSPNRIEDANDTNVTFYFRDDTAVTDTTLLVFDTQTSLKVSDMYVVPQSFTITEDAQIQQVTIVTVNAQNVGISTSVQIEQPNNGTDYGFFTPSGEVTTDASGVAVLTYTAPNSISSLSERNITITELSENISKELNIKYGAPAAVGTNYEITVDVPAFITVDSVDQVTVKINELGSVQNVILDENVIDVNLTSTFANILTFENASQAYNYNGAGANAIAVESKTISGTAIIEVSAEIFNGDSNVIITKQVPVVILSGPVTAMSLFYAGTDEDTDLGIYKNYYTIHAVDKYNNPAREGITLHPSIINGTKVVNSTGTTGQINLASPATFTDTNINAFTTVDTNDLLAIVPNANRINNAYLGNWTIDIATASTLELAEEYTEATTNGLSYIIGNSVRFLEGYGVATVDIKDRDNRGFVTDSNGNVQFEVTFDPVLAGHTVTISANAYDDNRTGAAIIAGLRWDNYDSTSESIPNDGLDHTITLGLGISDGVEKLIDVDIVPGSIMSNDATCDLNPLGFNNLHTNSNGEITVTISTGLTASGATDCTISWSATQGGIFKEY
jgi:hypothetical protein